MLAARSTQCVDSMGATAALPSRLLGNQEPLGGAIVEGNVGRLGSTGEKSCSVYTRCGVSPDFKCYLLVRPKNVSIPCRRYYVLENPSHQRIPESSTRPCSTTANMRGSGSESDQCQVSADPYRRKSVITSKGFGSLSLNHVLIIYFNTQNSQHYLSKKEQCATLEYFLNCFKNRLIQLVCFPSWNIHWVTMLLLSNITLEYISLV